MLLCQTVVKYAKWYRLFIDYLIIFHEKGNILSQNKQHENS